MKLIAKMGETTKQVRVDNWGIFFLQRLQMFFSKTDYCDMTLQFEGNVQLKVHRLVMNACTEYFQYLEQTCTLEDNIILMPADLQADVIVPIVNFMYTGMLEFHLSIFDRLYKTAQIMNITILTKLLDAQKQSVSTPLKVPKKKQLVESQHMLNLQVSANASKKSTPKSSPYTDLPATLPGRKLPVWKRKSIPSTSQSLSQQLYHSDSKWSPAVDPLSMPDNTPKPTRFEWPEDDLPPLNLMDTSFEDISYTSKPLLTKDEEKRANTSFDDLKHIPNASRSVTTLKKSSSPSLDMEEMKNYVKEQKIRSGLSQTDDSIDNDVEIEIGQKRKSIDQKNKTATKKVRFDEQENKTATISIAADMKGTGDLNHEKIVAELLKKYPQLVKKNKNIRLKIMAKNKTTALEPTKIENIQIRTPRMKVDESKIIKLRESAEGKIEDKSPWICDRCSTEDEPMEFVLYYLYRKHMTDVHNEKFDSKLCKYCGHRCNKHNLLMYHLYVKHGMKPPPSYTFPKCDQCPYIALSINILNKHKMRHGKNETQCVECKLAFTSQSTLTSHMQITGHTGKTNKNNYDCQYCTKRFQSGVNLFSHVRVQHKNEAIRDGFVSIDEIDEVEDEEEENSKDEYILPEIISEPEVPKKVNILSNVKVQDRHDQQRHQQLTLEPSSEAEALNNVATGIATSLGLVDIVVLNDNQQLFLQSDQQNFSNDQNEQPEFILPELTERETFTQNQNEVISSDGVITQTMLSSSDIASTDELVMVLTDHDYGDNQEEINNENSNIVVLYSHPVDGQQDQYITSEGNIMVNSQTGLIEIRNGTAISSTPNQVVMNSQESPHIESIEMIQREIESHGEMKQEITYEDEKPAIEKLEKTDEPTREIEPGIEHNQRETENLIESLTQGEQIEFTSTPSAEPVGDNSGENNENPQIETEINTENAEPIEEKPVEAAEENQQHLEACEESIEKPTILQEEPETVNEHQTPGENESKKSETVGEGEHDETQPVAKDTPEQPTEEEQMDISAPPEEDDKNETDETYAEPLETSAEAVAEELNESLEVDLVDEEVEVPVTNEGCQGEEKNHEECVEQELSQSDTSTSQFNDENSQSSQELQDVDKAKQQEGNVSAKISILDDWEDTDSQQSDNKESEKKIVEETVHKLMDDWEEEEEDESKKEVEN